MPCAGVSLIVMSTDRSLKNQARAIAVLTLTAVFATTSCSGTRSSGASSDPSTAATTPSSPGAPSNAPGVFTSAAYGYSVRVPARWTSTQATSKWNGQSGLDIEAPQVDKFHSPTTDPAFWAVATPWRQSLAAFASFAISWTSSFHGDSCTACRPRETRSPSVVNQGCCWPMTAAS